jgi:hypothetical protein
MEGDAKRALQTDLTGRPYHDFYTVRSLQLLLFSCKPPLLTLVIRLRWFAKTKEEISII